MFERPDRIGDPLYVCCAVFNPLRYRTRWALYQRFAKQVEDAGAILYTVELALGNRDFAVTSADNPRHIQVRSHQEIWHKEALLNIGFSRLPASWRFGMWLDADVSFGRPDWVGETLHQLQRYSVVQPFSDVHDLDHEYKPIAHHKGFAWSHCHRHEVPPPRCVTSGGAFCKKTHYWHPGFGQAWRREAFDAVGRLIDFAILGGGDTFMWEALAGTLTDRRMPKSLGKSGVKWLREWERRAEKHVRRNIGYVDGLLLHHWHGKRASRGYHDRGQILMDAEFDPEKHLRRDSQGLWLIDEDERDLRDGIRKYFGARNEDGLNDG